MARYLGLSLDTISRAFRALENDPGCPLAFASDYGGPGKTRRKLFALKSWLAHDRLPLFRRADGSLRHVRHSFRKDSRPLPTPRHPEQKERPGNSDFCRVGYKEKEITSADNPSSSPPPIGLSGKSPNGTAWRMARAALTDGEIFWHGCAVSIPLPTLRTLIRPAVERGLDWSIIRRALRHAAREAHAAARCSTRPIQNPGAFAAAIFRDSLGLRRAAPRRRQPSGHPRKFPAPRPVQNLKPLSVSNSGHALTSEEIAAGQRQRLELAAMLRAALGRPLTEV